MAAPEQTRLALVLNGGVSLAVWMGGVTHELDLLRRASRSIHSKQSDQDTESDEEVFELWRDVIRDADTHVLVDVIAGTSAGGLNGSFLATAIGRGTTLPDLRETWRDAAALTDTKLLKKPPYNSVLDGQFFEETIGTKLREMCEKDPVADPEPVTLFVTATALDGLPEDFQDGFGGRFDVDDHRRIYKFRHDPHAVTFRKTSTECNVWKPEPEVRNDFEDRLDLLKLAARASAGFPLAFAPVDESPLLEQRVRPDPQIPSRGRDRASWIVDGGLLNNAPFGPVLDAIADRRVDGPVRRVVIYIVPSTGVAQRHVENKPPCKATEWPSVLGTAISYPREADFRTGTAELCARMRKRTQNRHLELFKKQWQGGAGDRKEMLKIAESLFTDYQHSRVTGAAWKVRDLRDEGRGVRSLVGIPHDDAATILGNGPPPDWIPKSADELKTSSCHPWVWGASAAERLIWTLVGHIDERLRSTGTGKAAPPCAPTRSWRRAARRADDVADRQRAEKCLTDALSDLSACVRVVRAAQDAVFALIRNAGTSGDDPVQRGGADQGPTASLNAIYKDLGLAHIIGQQVHKAVNAFAKAIHGAHKADSVSHPRGLTAGQTLRACLTAEVVAQSFASPEELAEHAPQFEFLRLGPDEHSPLFPLDKYAPLGDRKLYGIRLNHFGAFVNPDWRASDFTWGRLDAAHHLLRLFITDHQKRRATEVKLHKAILQAEIGKEQMSRNLKALAEPNDADLFKGYLETKEGKQTAGKVVDAVLSILVGKGSPVRGPAADAGRTMFWRGFGRHVPKRHWPWPTRLVGIPGRWLWWWRVRKNPASAMGVTLGATIVTLFSTLACSFGLAALVQRCWEELWPWLILAIAVGGMLVVFILEFGLTVLWEWIRKKRQRRRERRRTRNSAAPAAP
ncbi:DUF3376 domain-containing protein [Streptomyces sp. NPDC055287]